MHGASPLIYKGLHRALGYVAEKKYKYLRLKRLAVRPFFYTFVPTKRERVCFQSVVRRVVKRQSKYCYKNATQLIVRIGIGLKYNDIGEVGSQTSLSAR